MPDSEAQPPDPDRPPSAQVLAAVQRAVRHAPRPGADASTAAVLAHLGAEPPSAAARAARTALARLEATAMVARSQARGRTCWRLAPRGHRRLRVLRDRGAEPALPESPQHRAWREARAAAAASAGRLRGELAAAARELETLALRDPPPGSDALLRAGEGAAVAARRLASALHCLHEWREPDDAVADTAPRAGLRNVRTWADGL